MAADHLVGTTLGIYQIEAKIGQGSAGGIYRATQTNIGRQVRLYVLDPQVAPGADAVQQFIANASVKANVSHPYILAVYEAGQAGENYFYSCEYIPCRSLRQIREAGEFLNETAALQAMKVAGEALAYFQKNNIAHNLISEDTILIGAHNKPRLANIAAFHPAEAADLKKEIPELGRIIAASLPETSTALGARSFALSLASGEKEFPTWESLLHAITEMEPKVAPEDAYKLDAQDRAAIKMVEEARKRQRRTMLISSGVSLGLLAVALIAIYFAFFSKDKGRTFTTMLEIPAGEFIYQDGQKVSLPTFHIDQCEVTIAQYAEFLDYLKKHPEEAAKFEHPDQPKNKSHLPKDWADEELATGSMPGYYTRAKRWGKFHDAPLDVNCPVFGVDWFDAYAYAKWKGHRLPTEQEWEKAARGTEGFLYPWGNEPNDKWVNSSKDFNPDPKGGGEVDGHDRWAPVDAVKKDESPFKVLGMAGNVSEWTATKDVDPQMASGKVPVIRGGNYRTPDYKLTRRVLKLMELESDEALGFRTVSDTPPPKK